MHTSAVEKFRSRPAEEPGRLVLWNLTDGGRVVVGAQDNFNIVGRLEHAEKADELTYRINGSAWRPVVFNRLHRRSGRLERFGDFSIDTLRCAELNSSNEICFRVTTKSGTHHETSVRFIVDRFPPALQGLSLRFHDVAHVHEAVQVVDGRWCIARDEKGEPCLELRPEDAGLDRIILCGSADWSTGYQLNARLSVTAWTRKTYNVGLLFNWNGHRVGDGSDLPTDWTTGLGYFCSKRPGLRVRIGVNVHFDSEGRKVGDHVLQACTLSRGRKWLARLVGLFARSPVSEIATGRKYGFQMTVSSDLYSLGVWREKSARKTPQIVLHHPEEILAHGSVGLIAYNCGVRLYDFHVTPINQPGDIGGIDVSAS